MLNAGTNDKNVENTLYEVHCWATDALPESENLWRSRLYFLYKTNQNDLAVETFNKVRIFFHNYYFMILKDL